MVTAQPLPHIPIDEEERLAKLTRAQKDAYLEMVEAASGHGSYRYSNNRRRHETLAAVVDAGLAEWRSAYPEPYPDAQHYIVPVGTPTYEQLVAQRVAANEKRLAGRAQLVLDRANHLNIVDGRVDTDNLRDLVIEIIRELEPQPTGARR